MATGIIEDVAVATAYENWHKLYQAYFNVPYKVLCAGCKHCTPLMNMDALSL